jgi:hypothetical protein
MDQLEQKHIQQIADWKLVFAKIASEQDEEIRQIKLQVVELKEENRRLEMELASKTGKK